MLTHKQLRTKSLANAEVKAGYEKLADEFSLLDEFLKERTVIAQPLVPADRPRATADLKRLASL